MSVFMRNSEMWPKKATWGGEKATCQEEETKGREGDKL